MVLSVCACSVQRLQSSPSSLPTYHLLEDIFTSSCAKLTEAPVEGLKDNLTIQFAGEAGMVCVCVCVYVCVRACVGACLSVCLSVCLCVIRIHSVNP